MTRGRKKPERYRVPAGYRCECDLCEHERNVGELRALPHYYCASCGHGYIVAGEGMCAKCGAREWIETKPDPPVAPLRTYRVQLSRQMRQSGYVTVQAQSLMHASDVAFHSQADIERWFDHEPSLGFVESVALQTTREERD